MHSTRVATFLLGAWLACCLFLDIVAAQSVRMTARFLSAPIAPAAATLKNVGGEQAALLLRHFDAEQSRYYYANWELMQIPIVLLIAVLVFFATGRRFVGPLIAGLILILVLFQAFAITPELGFRGRETDFPPGSQNVGTQARLWALTQVFIGVEAAKLLFGGILASYIFVFKSRRRARSSVASAAD